MADFSANWSASDRPVFPYNSGTEARIEMPQAPEDRARYGLQHGINNSFLCFCAGKVHFLLLCHIYITLYLAVFLFRKISRRLSSSHEERTLFKLAAHSSLW